jgi:hypothetical protein
MIIPKGKRFQFRSEDVSKTAPLASAKGFKSPLDVKGVSGVINEVTNGNLLVTPAFGYLGNAYIGQDVNINISSQYSKPLESILGAIPNVIDVAIQGKTGVSINNNRFTHMKYWTGTEAPEITVNLVFETQIDSYYDVYIPVMNVLKMALPYETELGFYKPPTPTIRLIAQEGATMIPNILGKINEIIPAAEKGTLLEKAKERAYNAQKTFSGVLENWASSVEATGFITDLYIGNNFKFKKILIKNISPTFSSELSYAPIYFINNLLKKTFPAYSTDLLNPYTMGEALAKSYAQTVCALAATGNNAVQGISGLLKTLPDFVRNIIMDKIQDIPSFPLRAEVNVTFELQYPLTSNSNGTISSMETVFDSEGFQNLY